MDDFIVDVVMPVIIAIAGAVLIFAMFIWLPVHAANEIECLEKGYPEANTTITLKGYCVNFDGAVTKKVVPLD